MVKILTEPTVEVIAATHNKYTGTDLITFHLRYWRAIHSELMTHRVFSRNARSSRATPIATNIEQVRNAPYGPCEWGLNEPGMTASISASDTLKYKSESQWIKAANDAADQAEELMKLGLHKQIVNRVLEPFMPIDTIVTATDWDNFFRLRTENHAQPEMQKLASLIKLKYDETFASNKVSFHESGLEIYHLPYIKEEDLKDALKEGDKVSPNIKLLNLFKISAARCARVSYKAYDGTVSEKADLELADKLLENGHLSPFEHQAIACKDDEYINVMRSNLKDFKQFRKVFENLL